jgi:predicted permease
VLAFTVAVTSVCAIVMGLAPAAHGRVERLADALRSSERGSTGGAATRIRSALVVAQVASAVILVAGAGLMIRSAQRLVALDPGFDQRSVIALRVSIPRTAPTAPDTPAPLEIFARILLDRARALPGVVAASLVTDPPLSGLDSAVFYGADGQPALDAQHRPRAYVHSVTPEFFGTMGIRLIAGRTFTETEQAPPVATVIVSEQVVRRFWPGQDPIGKRIKLGGVTSSNRWLTIVGVVAEVKYRGLPENPTTDPDLYFPFLDRNQQISLVVRAKGDPSSLAAPIRRLVREIDPNVPVFAVSTMEGAIAEQTARTRFTTWIMSGFGALALVLASIGVYGVMAYLVAQRRRELAVRMALGADRRAIVRLIVRGGGRLIAIGLAGGVCAVIVLERLARTLLFGVGAFDPATFAAAAVLGATGFLACYLPALRAAHVSPMEAFRAE